MTPTDLDGLWSLETDVVTREQEEAMTRVVAEMTTSLDGFVADQ